MPRVEKLDPRKTTVHDHRLNPGAVKFYEANPMVGVMLACKLAWSSFDEWPWNREIDRWNEAVLSARAEREARAQITVERVESEPRAIATQQRRELPPEVRIIPTPRREIEAVAR